MKQAILILVIISAVGLANDNSQTDLEQVEAIYYNTLDQIDNNQVIESVLYCVATLQSGYPDYHFHELERKVSFLTVYGNTEKIRLKAKILMAYMQSGNNQGNLEANEDGVAFWDSLAGNNNYHSQNDWKYVYSGK